MLVSIVICNYNYGRFLDGAINSALGQTDAATEVIVVDDGSTDNSAEVIAGFAGRIRAVFQHNAGQVAAYNVGLEQSRGECVVFLDADDTLDPHACSQIVAAFADPLVVKVHFLLRLVDVLGHPLGSVIPRQLADGDVSSILLKDGQFYDSSPGSGNAYLRSALMRLAPLPTSVDDLHGADFFALMGISLLGHVKAISDGTFGTYRVHAGNATEKIGFGNASPKEPSKTFLRYKRLQDWLVQRLGPDFRVPDNFSDFSIQKQILAGTIFETDGYLDGLRFGSKYLATELARSIWKRRSSVLERIGLTGWAVAIVVLPRPVGRPLARYVCNPASRTPIVPPWLASLVK